MPSYDVMCSACEYETVLDMRISELSQWDLTAVCPHCNAGSGAFRRVIRQAAALNGGEKNQRRSQLSKKADARSLGSGVKDDMLHKQWQKEDKHQIAEAREIVKSGKYEGF